MIELKDRQNCCGCQACMEACPAKCISMKADDEGFLYPKINQTDCIDCHLCEKVCPQLSHKTAYLPDTPISCYAAYSKDNQIRLQSSSGGVFSLLAKAILDRGGVVFGARFDDCYSVFHSYTETANNLHLFQGSKYAQSDLHGTYPIVHEFLNKQRPVLFTGTPCQIAGLRGYLHEQENKNLYLVSIVCHGVPSPQVWKDYLNSITGGQVPIAVSMRNKDNGWNQYRIIIQQEGSEVFNVQATDTAYMKAFLSNLTLRPSCYSCQFRGNHGSDLTLGDYWGVEKIHPKMSDNQGTSLILAYSEKGKNLLSGLDINMEESNFENALMGNPSIIHPAFKPAERPLFWKSYLRHGVQVLDSYTIDNTKTRIRRLWARLLRKLRRG